MKFSFKKWMDRLSKKNCSLAPADPENHKEEPIRENDLMILGQQSYNGEWVNAHVCTSWTKIAEIKIFLNGEWKNIYKGEEE
jgi:hypothetical protein